MGNCELVACTSAVAMASTVARCASSGLLGALEPLSAAASSPSTSAHAVSAFFPTKNGLEFASQALLRGASSVRSTVSNAEGVRTGGVFRNLKGVRASSAGVMETAPPAATREDPVIVNVDLGDRSYPIYIGAGLLDRPELLQKHVTGKKVRGCVGFFSGSF